MNKKDKALTLFQNGYNCAQSIFCAYSEDYGMEPTISFRLSQGFGGGIGHSKDLCGTACGMVMVASLHLCKDMDVDKDKKEAVYAVLEKMLNDFEMQNEVRDCKDLLAKDDGTRLHGKKKVCAKALISCCEIIDTYLK